MFRTKARKILRIVFRQPRIGTAARAVCIGLAIMQFACCHPVNRDAPVSAPLSQGETYIVGTRSRTLDLYLLSCFESSRGEPTASSSSYHGSAGEMLRAAAEGPGIANAAFAVVIPENAAFPTVRTVYLIFVISDSYAGFYVEHHNEFGMQRLNFDEAIPALTCYLQWEFQSDSGRLRRLHPHREEFSSVLPMRPARISDMKVFCDGQMFSVIPIQIGVWHGYAASALGETAPRIGSIEIDLQPVNDFIAKSLILLHPVRVDRSMDIAWAAALEEPEGSVVTIPLLVSDSDP